MAGEVSEDNDTGMEKYKRMGVVDYNREERYNRLVPAWQELYKRFLPLIH